AGLVAIVFTHRFAPLLFRTLLPDAMLPTTGVLRLAGVTSAVAIAVTLMIWLLPSLRSTRFDLLEALRTARAGRRGSALRRGLMFVQATLCAVLLVGAGMFLQSLQRARTADLGVDLSALAIDFELEDGTRGGELVSRAAYAALERIRALPFVEHAAVTTLPQFMGNLGITIRTARDSIVNGGRGPFFYSATGQYFEALGLRLLAGRTLTDADDRQSAAVAVISQSLARLAFSYRNAVGECLYLEEDAATGRCTRVVGVVEDAFPSIRAGEPNYNLYIPPHHISGEGVASGTVIVKTRGPAEPYLNELRRVARSALPGIRLVEVSPLSAFLASELQPWRLGAVLLTAFGVLALLVAAAGLYSLLSFDAAQRRFELGVRAAVGANARQLVAALALKSLAIAAAGIATGLLLAAFAARAAGALLFRISPTEPAVYVTVALTLTVVAASAAILPAVRAARLDPRVALQPE
ncbi:MAG TPA: FtsX-like permease family protein, partial [Longimicrobiales bacterium]|nr:FtsX-like permease family protein [Longimicrobiales bacterium]